MTRPVRTALAATLAALTLSVDSGAAAATLTSAPAPFKLSVTPEAIPEAGTPPVFAPARFDVAFQQFDPIFGTLDAVGVVVDATLQYTVERPFEERNRFGEFDIRLDGDLGLRTQVKGVLGFGDTLESGARRIVTRQEGRLGPLDAFTGTGSAEQAFSVALRAFSPFSDGRITLTDDSFIELVGTIQVFYAFTPGVETIETAQGQTLAQFASAFSAEVVAERFDLDTDPAPIPVPPALPLYAGALAVPVLAAWRRRRHAA